MKIQFVLVEPKVPENIGASARAIKTMGFSSLVLVNPCEWKDGKSKWVAHGSGDILENAAVFPTLRDALTDSDFIIATSSKQRTVKQDYVSAPDLKAFISRKAGTINRLSVVFGREESGLRNDEMALCDITSSIELAQPFPSLNLSQAVMLFAYELSDFSRITVNSKPSEKNESPSYSQLRQKIRDLLFKLELDENDNRFGRIMERIAFLEHDDINLMHTVCSMISSKLK